MFYRHKLFLPLVGLILLILGLILFQTLANPSPQLQKLDPAVGFPGNLTRVQGVNLGTQQNTRLFVGEEMVKPTDILSWTDRQIEFYIPERAVSGPLRLVTPSGRVTALFWVNQKELPRVFGEDGPRASSGAVIRSLNPGRAQVSELLVIEGEGFGDRPGTVLFPWGPLPANNFTLEPFLRVSGSEIEEWTDSRVKVRIPTGATSGTLRVLTREGFSSGVFFEIGTQVGSLELKNGRQYLLARRIEANWTVGESADRLVPVMGFAEDWMQRGFIVARQPGNELGTSSLEQGVLWWKVPARLRGQIVADWEAIYVTFQSSLRLRSDDTPEVTVFPALAPYLLSDEEIPWNNEFVRTLSTNTGGWPSPTRGPYKRARGLYYWLAQNFRWNEPAPPTALDALRLGRGSVLQGVQALVALLRASKIPARWVRGFLVLTTRQLVPHVWVEFYLPGVGWVGADPYLGSGYSPEGFQRPADPLRSYFAELDGKRLVLERQGESAVIGVESKGDGSGLDKEGIFWHAVEVTGFY